MPCSCEGYIYNDCMVIAYLYEVYYYSESVDNVHASYDYNPYKNNVSFRKDGSTILKATGY